MQHIEIGAVSESVRQRLVSLDSVVSTAIAKCGREGPSYWTMRTIGIDPFVALIVGDETVVALPESFVTGAQGDVLESVVEGIICWRDETTSPPEVRS
jgi:hypothetical protein